MAGRIEVYTDKSGECCFRLKAAKSQIIATGQGYKTKDACLNGIESIKNNAPAAKIVDAEDQFPVESPDRAFPLSGR